MKCCNRNNHVSARWDPSLRSTFTVSKTDERIQTLCKCIEGCFQLHDTHGWKGVAVATVAIIGVSAALVTLFGDSLYSMMNSQGDRACYYNSWGFGSCYNY